MSSWLIIFGLVLSSCVTRGTDFSSELTWIHKDKTTKDEVLQNLGEPFQVGYSSDSPTWMYAFYDFELFGDAHAKELKIFWNRDGTVASHSFSSSFPADKSAAIPPRKNESPK